MKNYALPSLAIIAIAIAVIFCVRSCHGSGGNTKSDTTTKVIQLPPDTVRVPVPMPYEVIKKVEIPKPYEVIKHDTVGRDSTITVVVDTLAFINKCLEEKHYRDSIASKTGYVILYDTVQNNALTGRTAIFHMTETQTTITKTEKNRVMYLGINFGGSNEFAMGGLHATYIDKKDNEFGLQGDFATKNIFIFSFRYGWKIKL